MEGIEELKHLLDPHHYEESFHEMDVEHHGYVTEDEFVQFARNHHVAMKEKEDAAALAKLVEDEARFIDFRHSRVFMTEEHQIF